MSDTLKLTKDEPLNLTKNEPLATKLQIGAGWDFKSGAKIDLDLLAHTDTKKVAYFGQKDPLNGAIVAGPDNRSGQGQGIDEFVEVDLSKVPTDVNKITLVLASYSGENFDNVEGEFIQLKDVATGRIIAKTVDPVTGSGKSLVFGSLIRSNNEWSFETTLAYHNDNFQEYVQRVIA